MNAADEDADTASVAETIALPTKVAALAAADESVALKIDLPVKAAVAAPEAETFDVPTSAKDWKPLPELWASVTLVLP